MHLEGRIETTLWDFLANYGFDTAESVAYSTSKSFFSQTVIVKKDSSPRRITLPILPTSSIAVLASEAENHPTKVLHRLG
jgi:hypothetical protein